MTDDRTPHDSLTDPIPTLAPVPPPTFAPAPQPPATVPVRRRGGPGFVSIVLGIAVLFAVGGVAFAAGRLTAPAPASAAAAGNGGFGAGRGNGNGFGAGGNGNGGNPFGAGGAGGGALGAAGLTIDGTVSAVATDHLTLTLPGGQTIDVPIDGSTTFHHQTGASKADVATGAAVEITLSGRGARGARNPAASGSPAPSASGGFAGRGLGTATDVTITGG